MAICIIFIKNQQYIYAAKYEASLVQRLSLMKMELTTRVQTLEEVVCVSLHATRKGLDTSVLPVMRK